MTNDTIEILYLIFSRSVTIFQSRFAIKFSSNDVCICDLTPVKTLLSNSCHSAMSSPVYDPHSPHLRGREEDYYDQVVHICCLIFHFTELGLLDIMVRISNSRLDFPPNYNGARGLL